MRACTCILALLILLNLAVQSAISSMILHHCKCYNLISIVFMQPVCMQVSKITDDGFHAIAVLNITFS